MTFWRGFSARASHERNPAGIFNASLDGKVRRAIDLKQHDHLNEQAFVELVRAAVALNHGSAQA